MTRKQIDASREIRLWISTIIAPVCIAGSILVGNPELREGIVAKTKVAKDFIKNKFKRKGS